MPSCMVQALCRVDEFQLVELDEITRQRGDNTFAELLCRVRSNDCMTMLMIETDSC